MRTKVAAGVAALGLVCGCSDGSASAEDVVESVDGRSAADTLTLLVVARTTATDPSGSTEFLDYHHVRSVRLSVDGKEWGLFETADPAPTDDSSSSWLSTDQPSKALVVAALGSELESAPVDGAAGGFDTVAEWVAFLDKHLAPGGHVAGLEELDLVNTAGETIQVFPRSLVPFTVAQGDAIAYVGEVTVDVDVGASGGEK